MKIINNMVKNILYLILKIFAPKGFQNKHFNVSLLFKHFVMQKIFGINHHVNWPIHKTTVVKVPEKIQKGSRCPGLSPWCYFDGRNGIIIGDNVWIGPRVSLISMNHDVHNYEKYIIENPIKIGNDCWIAAGAIITAGVQLGNHVVVASGAVVTKSFPSNVLIGGVPAKIIKHLEAYEKES